VLALVSVPLWVAVVAIVVGMTAIACWGVLESVTFAAALTVVEIAGLLVIVGAGVWADPGIISRLPEVLPPLGDAGALTAVFGASLIAFFAFIGFDDVVNLVEETKTPARIMPLGILLTLGLATAIYFMVVSVAVLSAPLDLLASASAPISVLFERLTGLSPVAITLIAIVATLNGIVIQIIMAARVLYGLSNAGHLPSVFALLNPVTRTPLVSSLLIGAAVLALALTAPIGALAQATTQIVLVVFVLVSLSLVIVKSRGDAAPEGAFLVPIWAPRFGAVFCAALLIGPLFT
jgi:APA family basic amino acid/polyamine antiporter